MEVSGDWFGCVPVVRRSVARGSVRQVLLQPRVLIGAGEPSVK